MKDCRNSSFLSSPVFWIVVAVSLSPGAVTACFPLIVAGLILVCLVGLVLYLGATKGAPAYVRWEKELQQREKGYKEQGLVRKASGWNKGKLVPAPGYRWDNKGRCVKA